MTDVAKLRKIKARIVAKVSKHIHKAKQLFTKKYTID